MREAIGEAMREAIKARPVVPRAPRPVADDAAAAVDDEDAAART